MYVIGLLLTLFSSVCFSKIDESVDIFFPPSLKFLQKSQAEFPVFWWNFLVVDPKNGKASFSEAGQVCAILKKLEVGDDSPQGEASAKNQLKHVICDKSLTGYMKTLGEWSRDIVLREEFSQSSPLAESHRGAILDSLTQLSMMSSSEKNLWALKRRDPLDQWQIYLEKSQAISPSNFQRQQGVLLDPLTQRIVIPIQFAGPPKMVTTQSVMQELQTFEGIHLVGGHGAAFSNEAQIHKDLSLVSWVGLFVLLGFVLFLVFKGRVGALLLLPPVAISVGLAAWVVELMFGSIHGLTLAFGSGIVGLALDYGLHGAFGSESQMTWRSNAVGFLTTFVGLLVLALSQIPLLRQMMIFSALGIFFGFLSFYFLCRFLPKFFSLEPLVIEFPMIWGRGFVVLVLVVCGVLGAGWSQMKFDLRDLNFQSAADSQAMNWFFSQGPSRETFLEVHAKADFGLKTSIEKKWSTEKQIQYVGLGEYLPSVEQQRKNQASWQGSGCNYFKGLLSVSETRIFSPFVEDICRSSQEEFDFGTISKKTYLRDLIAQDQFVSLWFAKDSTQATQIREAFPEARSMMEAVGGFSIAMQEDLRWMIPTILILCTLILGIHYRSLFYVLASYIPFLSGMGLFFIVKFVLREHIDLISILGLLMVFGFSIDYGVFVTDVFAFSQDREHLPGVHSVLSLAALTNVIGFFPLVFAQHPVLHNLGSSLFFGTIGTYLGTSWGIERFLRLKNTGGPIVKKLGVIVVVCVLTTVISTAAMTLSGCSTGTSPVQMTEKLLPRNRSLFPEGRYQQEVVVEVIATNPKRNFEFDCFVQRKNEEMLFVGYNSFGVSLFRIREIPGQLIEAESSIEEIRKNKDFFIKIFKLVKQINQLKRDDPNFHGNEVTVGSAQVVFANYDQFGVPLSFSVEAKGQYRVQIKTTDYKIFGTL